MCCTIKVLEDKETVVAEDFYKFARRIAQELKVKEHEEMDFIYDNASIHKTQDLKRMLKKQSANFHPLPLPPYSPRLNPIEHVWHTLKEPIKHVNLTDGESVRRALIDSQNDFNKNHADSFPRYFKHVQEKIYPLALDSQPMH